MQVQVACEHFGVRVCIRVALVIDSHTRNFQLGKKSRVLQAARAHGSRRL